MDKRGGGHWIKSERSREMDFTKIDLHRFPSFPMELDRSA